MTEILVVKDAKPCPANPVTPVAFSMNYIGMSKFCLNWGTFEHTELLPEPVGPTKLNNTFEKVNGRYVENVLRYNDIMRRQIFSASALIQLAVGWEPLLTMSAIPLNFVGCDNPCGSAVGIDLLHISAAQWGEMRIIQKEVPPCNVVSPSCSPRMLPLNLVNGLDNSK